MSLYEACIRYAILFYEVGSAGADLFAAGRLRRAGDEVRDIGSRASVGEIADRLLVSKYRDAGTNQRIHRGCV